MPQSFDRAAISTLAVTDQGALSASRFAIRSARDGACETAHA